MQFNVMAEGRDIALFILATAWIWVVFLSASASSFIRGHEVFRKGAGVGPSGTTTAESSALERAKIITNK